MHNKINIKMDYDAFCQVIDDIKQFIPNCHKYDDCTIIASIVALFHKNGFHQLPFHLNYSQIRLIEQYNWT